VNIKHLAVLNLCLLAIFVVWGSFSGCGSYNAPIDRRVSEDGRFWVELTVTRASAVAGGDHYWVEIGKTAPTWLERFALENKAGICSLEGPGRLSVSWTGPRRLSVVCSECRKDAFFISSKEWKEVMIEYNFRAK
jgi:hypothetical protein